MKSSFKNGTGFHQPFLVLKGLSFGRLESPTNGLHPQREDTIEEDDQVLFMKEMEGVTPLPPSPNRVLYPKAANMVPRHLPRYTELEALDKLERLALGQDTVDIIFRDDYVEGHLPFVPKDVMNKLRLGIYSVQDYLDLHGLTRQEAEAQLCNFLNRSYSLGYRCVLVVHGKGNNSKDSIPVLKEMVPQWLTKAPLRRFVLAFCSARSYDGGTGALYVLLKKWRKKDGNRNRRDWHRRQW